MKKIYLGLILLFILNNLSAQSPSVKLTQRSICATDGNVPDELIKIRKTNPSFLLLSGVTSNCYYINVFFHIVRNTNGTGGQNVQVLTTIMNNLATVYAPQNVSFINTGNDEVRNDLYMTNFDDTKYYTLIAQNTKTSVHAK